MKNKIKTPEEKEIIVKKLNGQSTVKLANSI